LFNEENRLMRTWIRRALRAWQRPARRPSSHRLRLDVLEDRAVPATGGFMSGNNFLQTNVVANVAGVAANTDPNLVNPFGIADGTGGPFWVSDSGTNVSTLYSIPSTATGPNPNVDGLVVAIPGPFGSAPNVTTSPTGTTAPSADGTTFEIPGTGTGEGAGSKAAFLFATAAGTIAAWDGKLNPITEAVTIVDNSAKGSDFTGLTSGLIGTNSFIYVTDIRNGAIDVFDSSYQAVPLSSLSAHAFEDPKAIKAGLTAYNIQNLGGDLFVTYAKVGADGNPVLGAGKGLVAEFDTSGNLIQTFGGHTDAPYGVALAPAGFGRFGGDLLVANTGTGTISAFDVGTGKFDGTLNDTAGQPLVINGLKALHFGNGAGGGVAGVLYFTADPTTGPAKGLFGSLSFVAETKGAQADTALLQTELALHAGEPALQSSLLTLLKSAKSQLNQDVANGVKLSRAQDDLLTALENVTAEDNPAINHVAVKAHEAVIDAQFLELVDVAFD
jgi:uncharacterized protein (TIGR03118 family)